MPSARGRWSRRAGRGVSGVERSAGDGHRGRVIDGARRVLIHSSRWLPIAPTATCEPPAYPIPVTRRPVASQIGQLARRNRLSGAPIVTSSLPRGGPPDGLGAQGHSSRYPRASCPRRKDPYRIEGSGSDGGRVSGGSHVAVCSADNQRDEWMRNTTCIVNHAPPAPPTPVTATPTAPWWRPHADRWRRRKLVTR